MGSGGYDTTGYATRAFCDTSAKRAKSAGYDPAVVKTFVYDADVKSGKAKKVHDLLDPLMMTNGVRESRDSAEHPESIPVAVFIDVTGSMSTAPKRLFDGIKSLMGALVKNGIEHPQILFGAVGDAYCDDYPFQVSQFESDNRMEEQIANLILESGGGNNNSESYDLVTYFLARCTATDSLEKRHKKGYAFLIQDEPPPDILPKDFVKKVFGQDIQADIPFKDLIAETNEKWDMFILRPLETYYGKNENVTKQWERLFPGRVIQLQSIDGISEQIALILANEEGIDLDSVVESLVSSGSSMELVLAAKNSVGKSSSLTKATISGDIDLSGKRSSRL